MEEEKILAVVIGAILGFISTYILAIVKFRHDLREKYDLDLRDKRVAHYNGLWKLTRAFPKYGRDKPVTHEDIRSLTLALRDWYFMEGGMFLSDESRAAYFALQDGLQDALNESRSKGSVELKGPTHEKLRSLGSSLRLALVHDVGTRRPSELNRDI